MTKSCMAFRFAPRAEASDEIDLDIYDVVGDSWYGGVSAQHARELLSASRNAKQINVRINSGGGDVFDGLAIYNLLTAHPARVVVSVDGLAASIASIIAMAGDEIHMAENSSLMVHNPWTFTMGEASDLRKDADLLDKLTEQLVLTYTARTGQAEKQVRQWMADETWMTAAEAKERGFATHITPAKQLAASAYDLSKFRNVPQAVLRVALRSHLTPENAPPEARDVNSTPKDNTMNEKEFQAKLDKLEAEAATLRELNASLQQQASVLTTERDAAREAAVKADARASAAESQLIAAEVKALVGVKITPAEEASFVALAGKDRELFNQMIAARPELGLISDRIAADPSAPEQLSDSSSGIDELSAAAETRARS